MTPSTNPRTFQMPGNAWSMVKRIVRAYGAAQNDENSNVEAVAKLAGIHRPIVSSNNNFLRSMGLLDPEKPKLTPLGVKLATGIGLENPSIVTEALQEAVLTTPVLAQLVNTLRARGAMDVEAFRGQIILAVGLNENSSNLPMVKTLIDLLEEAGLTEVRENRVFLRGTPRVDVKPPTTEDPVSTPPTLAGDKRTDPNVKPSDTVAAAWSEMLLAKFPQFDPSWTDDVKLKWFDAFDRLMKGRGM